MFWIDILLLSIDICQWVTCIYFKINQLKNEKMKKTGITVQNAGNRDFGDLSSHFAGKGVFNYS